MKLRFSSNCIDNENQLMPVIIKVLQDNGGELTKHELENEIANESDEWNKYVNHYKPSSKYDDSWWRPFDFTYSYSIKHLKLAGYVEQRKMMPVKLTDKGITTEADKLIGNEIRAISDPLWKDEAEQKKAAKNNNDDQDQSDEETINESYRDDIWRAELKQKLIEMNPYKFELFCRGLLKKMGIAIDDEKGIQKSNDGGIDGYGYSINANYRTERVALQCKRYNEGPVSSRCINEFRGAISRHSAEYGIFITTSTFTKSATESAKIGKEPVTLINGDQLIDLIIKLEYKVRKVSYYIPDDTDAIWND